MYKVKVPLVLSVGLTALLTGVAAPAQARQPAAGTAVAVAAAPGHAVPGTAAHSVPEVYARAAYLLDAATGEELYDKAGTERMPVASLTKVMTAYLVLRQAKLTDTVVIDPADVRYANAGGGTTAGLRAGDRLTVEDLLYALMLPSGADAAHALARVYGPGVEAFTKRMNDTARELGLTDTTYLNADGLPTPEGQNTSTARDQARLAEIALRDPRLKKITSTQVHTVARTADHAAYTWRNTNRLLGAPGVIGVKTGFTLAAGFCLAFAAEGDGRLVVGVILGETVSARRYTTARALLDWAAERAPAAR